MAVIGARPATGIGVFGRRPRVRPRSRPRPVARARRASRRAAASSISSILIAIAAAAGLALFYLSQSTHVSAIGYQIDGLETHAAQLRAEQQQLILQIGQARSPATIEQRAASSLHLVAIARNAIRFAPTSTDPTP
jgi:cell division protein FtsB